MPHREYTLDRVHHQQWGLIKNPTTITVWRSSLQMSSLLWSHLQSWPQSGSFSGTVRQYYTGLPKHWRRRPGRPRQTWLRTIENDLRPLNLGLATAQQHAQNRTTWQTLVETAMSLTSSRWWWWGDVIKTYKMITGKNDKAVPILKLMGPSSTRGHYLQLAKENQDMNYEKKNFSSRILNMWISLPNDVVSAKIVNCFKSKLDEFWHNQDVRYHWHRKLE